MTKIVSAHLSFYRNEAHYESMVIYREKLYASPAVLALVQTFMTGFEGWLDKEGRLVDAQKKNPYTAQIVEADSLDDRLVLGIKEIVSASMRHYNPVIVAAATRLDDRLRAFGRIESKSYEEEAAALSILVYDLQSPVFMADAITVGLEGWLEQLTEAVTNFRNLLQLRNESVAPILPQENLKTVRREIDVIYHKMTTRINAAAELDATGQYDAFIRQLNAEIHYFNEHTHIHARKDLGEGDHTVIEPIEVQQYTGEAITPIPVAYYHGEGKPPVKLTFAEDFTLTYKNNVKPGMATVTVHGKGAYRGRKATTFSIVAGEQ